MPLYSELEYLVYHHANLISVFLPTLKTSSLIIFMKHWKLKMLKLKRERRSAKEKIHTYSCLIVFITTINKKNITFGVCMTSTILVPKKTCVYSCVFFLHANSFFTPNHAHVLFLNVIKSKISNVLASATSSFSSSSF